MCLPSTCIYIPIGKNSKVFYNGVSGGALVRLVLACPVLVIIFGVMDNYRVPSTAHDDTIPTLDFSQGCSEWQLTIYLSFLQVKTYTYNTYTYPSSQYNIPILASSQDLYLPFKSIQYTYPCFKSRPIPTLQVNTIYLPLLQVKTYTYPSSQYNIPTLASSHG